MPGRDPPPVPAAWDPEQVSIRDAQLRALRRQIEAGQNLGHDIDQGLVRVRISRSRYGVASTCSCGWRSDPKWKPIKAIASAMIHLGMVVGEGEPRTTEVDDEHQVDDGGSDHGVSLPESVRPRL